MTRPWWSNDDTLLGSLDGALRAARQVPRAFVEAGKAEYTWHSIDAELAALTYDSALESPEVGSDTRADAAPLRALTFASAELTIELEVTRESLLGQLVPPQPGEVEVRPATGRTGYAAIDDIGCFLVRPIPTERFRLYCQTVDGAHVLTGWISL